jgi:hypothetical protein
LEPTRTIILPASNIEAEIRRDNGSIRKILRLGLADKELDKAYLKYWAACTVRLGDNEKVRDFDIRKLWNQDQEFLAIEIYRFSYGDMITLKSTCSGEKCDEMVLHKVDLSKLDLKRLPEGTDPATVEHELVLPISGKRVTWGLTTGVHEQAEMAMEGFGSEEMSFFAIRSIDGSSNVKPEDVIDWPGEDHIALLDDIQADENRIGYDTRVRLKHDKCGKRQVINILLDPSFVLPFIYRLKSVM